MTGLVYLAIIALWMTFLIPWLGRQRDDQHGRKSADHYHRAMDTLARARHHEAEPEEDDATLSASPGPSVMASLQQSWRTVAASVRPSARARRSPTMKRRRRVLLLLGTASLGALAGAVFGLVPAALPVGGLMLLVLYLTALTRSSAGTAATSAASDPSAQTDRYREATRRAQAQASGMLNPTDESRWDAVPATLPTYVSKPRAPKVPRVVDLKSPYGGWTGESMLQAVHEERRRSAQQQFEREMVLMEPDAVDEVAQLAHPAPPAARQQWRRAATG